MLACRSQGLGTSGWGLALSCMNVRKAAVAGTWYPGAAAALARGGRSSSRRSRSRRRRRRRRARRPDRAACRADVLGPGRRARVPPAARPRASTSSSWSGRRTSSASTACRCIRPADSRRRSASRRSTRTCAARDRRRRRRSCASIPPRTRASTRSRCSCRFCARLAPRLPIVPLLMGYQTRRRPRRRSATRSAIALRGRRALLVASTDLSHYHDAATARALDRVVIDCVVALRRRRPAGGARRDAASTRAAADRRSR